MNNAYQTEGLSLTNVKRAIIAAQAGNRPLARLNLENAIDSEQNNPDYWLWLAWTTDSPAGAVSALEQALRLSPDHHLAQQGLAWALSMQGYDADDYIEQSTAVSVEADPIEHELSDHPCDVEAFAMGDREEEHDVDEDRVILEHVTELETACDDLLSADSTLESTPADNTESTSDELDTWASDDNLEQPFDVDASTEDEAEDQGIVLIEDHETVLDDSFELELSWDDDLPAVDSRLESTPSDNKESTSDELETWASDDNTEQPIDVEALTENEADDHEIVRDRDQEAGLEETFGLELSRDDEVPVPDASPELTSADNTESTSADLEALASDDNASQPCRMETTEDAPTIPEDDAKREFPSRNDLQQADASCEETPERSHSEEGLTVLVVDDSPTIRKVVSMSLGAAGYAVVTASDGMEAIKQMTDCTPSLVLTDINMPAIDGYQLCKLIKSHEKTRSIPVIMLSGKDGMFDKIKGKFVGCDDYITKPFQSAELLEKVTSRLPLPVSDSHS